MVDRYRALHTENIVMNYGKNERIPAKSNKIPMVTIIDGHSVEWVVKGLIFNTTTKFIYNSHLNSSGDNDSTLYSQVDNPRVYLTIFGKNIAEDAIITKELDDFGNKCVQYWYKFTLIN